MVAMAGEGRIRLAYKILSAAVVLVSLASVTGSVYVYSLGYGRRYLLMAVLWAAVLAWALSEASRAFRM
ncbi:hypothetical protein apy_05390 [Aeropyrum pernix]|uniref:Uncharacterized protein n=1 Tax=Aeropyrum pernix TaxID=56636 RepID=A0A401H8T2_AERPX|nr:hypothetical protein apy_05390 [Aeropyrum pernix]